VGGAHRLAAFMLASSVAHAAVLVGVTGAPTIDVTTNGQAEAISVRLVPAGAGGHEGMATTGVAEAVPRATEEPTSQAQTSADRQLDPAAAHAAASDGSSQGDAASARTTATAQATEQAAKGEPDKAAAQSPSPSAAPSEASAASQDAHRTVEAGEQLARAIAAANADGDSGEADQRQLAQRARAAVERKLAEHFRYPRLARQRGWEGRVVLSFRIDAAGHIEAVHVMESSGRAILDDTAAESLRAIDRLPGLADRLGSTPLDLTLPVTFRLKSG